MPPDFSENKGWLGGIPPKMREKVGAVNKRRIVTLKTTRFVRSSGKQKMEKNNNSSHPPYIIDWWQLLFPFSFYLFLLASNSAGQVLSLWEPKLGNCFVGSGVELRIDMWCGSLANWRAQASARFQDFRFTLFGLNFFVPFFQNKWKKNILTLWPYSKWRFFFWNVHIWLH